MERTYFSAAENEVKKVKTHIEGFDQISRGGIPYHRNTLIAGTSGCGKTIFAMQFLANGITCDNENAVFVTFEEPPDNIVENVRSFNWDIRKWMDEGKFAFIDASVSQEPIQTGEYSLIALLARIENAIKKVKASRVAIDSLGSLLYQFQNDKIIRRELIILANRLKQLNVTVVMTAERTNEYGEVSRYGIEEFVSDNVIILRNNTIEEKRRRTVEILKYRGAFHQKGEYPFTILPRKGIVGTSLTTLKMNQPVSVKRITSGDKKLDRMCNGGFLSGSIVLISGATGTGKTLLVTEFLKGGVESDEKSLLFAFEESKEQIVRNASGWNVDFNEMEKGNKLKIIALYPEVLNLEEHLIEIKTHIENFNPQRIAIDSLSALERMSSSTSITEFVIGLTSFIKEKQISAMITISAPTIMGAGTITSAHISTITDSIILLRYLEHRGCVKRGITILKMRGSFHDREIREFSIDNKGIHIKKPFKNIQGILSGHPVEYMYDVIGGVNGSSKDLSELLDA